MPDFRMNSSNSCGVSDSAIGSSSDLILKGVDNCSLQARETLVCVSIAAFRPPAAQGVAILPWSSQCCSRAWKIVCARMRGPQLSNTEAEETKSFNFEVAENTTQQSRARNVPQLRLLTPSKISRSHRGERSTIQAEMITNMSCNRKNTSCKLKNFTKRILHVLLIQTISPQQIRQLQICIFFLSLFSSLSYLSLTSPSLFPCTSHLCFYSL